VKHFGACGEDLWECIVEECQKGTINARINILYFLDSLCETCLLVQSRAASQQPQKHSHGIPKASSSASTADPNKDTKGTDDLYVTFLARDLGSIVENVVPEGRQGLPNLASTKQILESWRSKRVIDPQRVEDVLSMLNTRQSQSQSQPQTSPSRPSASHEKERSEKHNPLPRTEVFKRIEEDRERHKRLREKRWVQPVSHSLSAPAAGLASFLPLTTTGDGAGELTIDIEFENEWETTSDWNEDDEEACAEEREMCFPMEGEGPMDLS